MLSEKGIVPLIGLALKISSLFLIYLPSIYYFWYYLLYVFGVCYINMEVPPYDLFNTPLTTHEKKLTTLRNLSALIVHCYLTLQDPISYLLRLLLTRKDLAG